MKQNYGCPFFVYYALNEKIPANFGNGDMYMKILDLSVNMEWCAVNDKSRKMALTKTGCSTAVHRTTLVVSSNGKNQSLV
jgi:hypothetical protein